jgi:hypothetical protein
MQEIAAALAKQQSWHENVPARECLTAGATFATLNRRITAGTAITTTSVVATPATTTTPATIVRLGLVCWSKRIEEEMANSLSSCWMSH